MSEFKGFPAKMTFTPIPNLVFSSVLPQITDISELKVLLHIFELIYPKKGNTKYVSYNEMLRSASLVNDLKDQVPEVLPGILTSLTEKGILLTAPVKMDGTNDHIYVFNNEDNRNNLQRILSREMLSSSVTIENPGSAIAEPPADIFTLYEQNIGMLTPLIADEIRESEKLYPEVWIRDAIKEAVSLNKRNWRYIARILERWSTEGRNGGTHRGNLKKNTDPDKFIKGRYGHMVQR